MLYELRMYKTAPGRVADVANRMRDLIPAIFAKHGMPTPMAEWIVSAGAETPMYMWMLSWPDSAVRAKAFASLYGDADWAELRRVTNGVREMVLQYDIYFMHAAPAWEAAKVLHADKQGPAQGLHELRIWQCYPGKLGQANATLADVDLPALSRAGGTTLGVFDIQSGHDLPAFAQFVHWDSYEVRKRGWASQEADAAVVAARKAEVDALNTHVLGRHRTFLMEPCDFRVARHHFA